MVEVTCRCGWVTRGTKQEVIASVQAHGRTAHQQELTASDVRAVWKTVQDSGPKK
jgi:predicted small metal-binding protein